MHNEHGDGAEATANAWADHINEAYYDGMGGAFGARTRDRINWMCSQVVGESVLDIGCSQGISTILLAREGLKVTGIDIDQPTIDYAMAERAKEIPSVQERIEFQCVELSSLSAGTFDTVIMGEVIEHQTSPTRFLARAATFLAPGGRLIVTVPFGLNPWPDHKSTIFPGDLAQGLPEDFILHELSASDGYIRMVADRALGEAVEPAWNLMLSATRVGALDVHRKYYEATDQLQQLRKQKAVLESSIKAVQGALDEETKEKKRLELEWQHEQQRFEGAKVELGNARTELDSAITELGTVRVEHGKTKAELESVKAELGSVQSEHASTNAGPGSIWAELEDAKVCLENVKVELESSRLELGSAYTELRNAKADFGSASAKVASTTAELERLRRELKRVSEREKQQAVQLAQKFVDEKSALEAQLGSLRAEFAVAQTKRTGHFLHLEAERAYVRLLHERLRELHEENYRFQNSLALAIGRAVLELRTLRGVLGFPRSMVRALRMYRGRGNSIPALQLPARFPVQLPSPAALPTPVVSATAKTKTNATKVGGEEARKQLSVTGWSEQLEADKVVVMSVMDEFSRACFAPHANLIEPRPDNWEALLDRYRPQFLFIESSWKGNFGTWQYRVANYANPPGNELVEMVAEFKKRGIPTVFWNKEDPVHFKDFIAKAVNFDHVFTTAEEVLPNYSDKTNARLGVLQFAAEEALHNPIGSSERNGKLCFAGSFYANRFQERRDDQLMLLDAARDFNFDIFDRNYKPDSAPSDFSFPERFSANIRGSLSYSEVNEAYRRYRVFLNVNSVVDSPTMFSRRVFELLACGTPVVSTWSEGTEATFGSDLIWHVRSTEEAKEALGVLMNDDREWSRRSLQGIREVFAKHTYRHRFSQICESLGIQQPQAERYMDVLVVAEAASELEIDLVVDAFRRQQLHVGSSKRLVVVCRGDFANHHKVEAPAERIELVHSDLTVGEVVSRMGEDASRCVIAVMSARVTYGRFYLQDLINALRYSGAKVVGKSRDTHLQYLYGAALEPSSLVVAGDRVAAKTLACLLDGKNTFASNERSVFAADQANYSRTQFTDLGRIHAEVQKIEI